VTTQLPLKNLLLTRIKYFLWYMVFLPFYLPTSSLMRRPKLGFLALSLWILGQAAWLQQGYGLEFLGKSTFIPGLWTASAVFFGVNCWILGIIVADVGSSVDQASESAMPSTRKAE
jgi:phosphatidylinositol glycan class M